MPVIEVKLWAGRTREQKKSIATKITQAFLDEGVPAGAIHVVFFDVEKADWAIGGKLSDE